MAGFLDITIQFLKDISMEFGLVKFRKLTIKRRKIVPSTYQINENVLIDALKPRKSYRYTG